MHVRLVVGEPLTSSAAAVIDLGLPEKHNVSPKPLLMNWKLCKRLNAYCSIELVVEGTRDALHGGANKMKLQPSAASMGGGRVLRSCKSTVHNEHKFAIELVCITSLPYGNIRNGLE